MAPSPTASPTPRPTDAPVAGPATSRPTPSPTAPPPPTDARLNDIQSILISASGNGAALNDTSTPQYEALDWIAHVDGLRLNPLTHPEWVVQRHALATLYFATADDSQGGGGNGGGGNGDGGWTTGARFLSDEPECNWNANANALGITGCINDEGTETQHVTHLNLRSNGLDGTLPPELALLTDLRKLDLGVNSLRGELPSTLGDLPRLDSLQLDANAFKDRVPSRWRRLNKLTTLDLSWNELTGSILPAVFTGWTSMQSLRLNDNDLTGPLPTSIQNMQNLRVLNLSENEFAGTLPLSLYFLGKLELLDLSKNAFEGSIPTSLFRSNFPALGEVRLDDNDLTGVINFCNLEQIIEFQEEVAGSARGVFTSDCLAPGDGTAAAAEITQCLCCTQCCRQDSATGESTCGVNPNADG